MEDDQMTDIEQALYDEETRQRNRIVRNSRIQPLSRVCDTQVLYRGERFVCEVNGKTVEWRDGDVQSVPRWMAVALIQQHKSLAIVGKGEECSEPEPEPEPVPGPETEMLPTLKEIHDAMHNGELLPHDVQTQMARLRTDALREKTREAIRRFWTYWNKFSPGVARIVVPVEMEAPDDAELLDENGNRFDGDISFDEAVAIDDDSTDDRILMTSHELLQ